MNQPITGGIVLPLLLASFCVWSSTAYRVGDPVDVIYRTPTESMDALRHQMPLFGVPSSSNFDEDAKRFSLSFEDGGQTIPWIEVVDRKGRPLEQLVVTFVYSKSGVGAIHSISSQTTYNPSRGGGATGGGSFSVQYEWIEEAPVDMASGLAIMFLATCVVSIIFLLQSCGQTDEGSGAVHRGSTPQPGYGISSASTSIGGSVPKWD